jgi:hypothetical protein
MASVGRQADRSHGGSIVMEQKPRRPVQSGGGIPGWLLVVIALIVIFVVLPALTPFFWQIYLATH